MKFQTLSRFDQRPASPILSNAFGDRLESACTIEPGRAEGNGP